MSALAPSAFTNPIPRPIPLKSPYAAMQPAFLEAPVVRSLTSLEEAQGAKTPAGKTKTGQSDVTIPFALPKAERTRGMVLFDTLLYPILTNAAVFAISVFATYQTTHGKPWLPGKSWVSKWLADRGKTAEGQYGNWFKNRGDNARDWLVNTVKFNNKPLFNAKLARESVMIGFSFLDGCVMAPVVKLFEDRRIPIVKKLDQWMGTTPPTEDPYKQEPKQSWKSVGLGRLAAAAMVVPTAKVFGIQWGEKKVSLNDVLFGRPGEAIGNWVKDNVPAIGRKFPNLNLPGLGEVSMLELVYTSLCTAGLYLVSRQVASRQGHSQEATPPSAPIAGGKAASPGLPQEFAGASA